MCSSSMIQSFQWHLCRRFFDGGRSRASCLMRETHPRARLINHALAYRAHARRSLHPAHDRRKGGRHGAECRNLTTLGREWPESALSSRSWPHHHSAGVAPSPILPWRGCNGEVGGFGSLPVCRSLRCPCLRAVICRLKPRHSTLSTRISDPGRHSGLIDSFTVSVNLSCDAHSAATLSNDLTKGVDP